MPTATLEQSKNLESYQILSVPFKLDKSKSHITKQDDGMEVFNFEGYASTFGNVDRHGHEIDRHAFDNHLGKNDVKMLLLHNQFELAIGIWTEIKTDDHGLYVKGSMPLDDARVKEQIIPQMKIGSVDSMSIGIYIYDYKPINNAEGKISHYRLTDVELIEISIVNFPANDKAKISAIQKHLDKMKQEMSLIDKDKDRIIEVKVEKKATPRNKLPKTFTDKDRKWDKTSAINRVRKKTGSEENASSSYKSAFLWYDSENEENLTAYKLPIADVIKDKLTIVPKAVFSAAAAIRGARGGVDIPDSEKKQVIKNINYLYDQMGLESPFDENSGKSAVIQIDELKELDADIIRYYCQNGYKFSRKSADLIAYNTVKDIDCNRDGADTVDLSGLSNKIESMLKKLGKDKTNV